LKSPQPGLAARKEEGRQGRGLKSVTAGDPMNDDADGPTGDFSNSFLQSDEGRNPQLMLYPLNREDFCQHLESIFSATNLDLYTQFNAMRDWVNAQYPNFELYLEDTWNERVNGETHIEYILRSRRTLNETDVLGYDVYQNHRDSGGVWHLGDYTHSVRLFSNPSELYDFIEANQG
jgi:hypothetical protein